MAQNTAVYKIRKSIGVQCIHCGSFLFTVAEEDRPVDAEATRLSTAAVATCFKCGHVNTLKDLDGPYWDEQIDARRVGS